MTEDREALASRTRQLMAESEMSWNSAWKQAESELESGRKGATRSRTETDSNPWINGGLFGFLLLIIITGVVAFDVNHEISISDAIGDFILRILLWEW